MPCLMIMVTNFISYYTFKSNNINFLCTFHKGVLDALERSNVVNTKHHYNIESFN